MEIFMKEGISTKEQFEINMAISDKVNTGKTEQEIVEYLRDYRGFTIYEATQEVEKAKLFMGWYALGDKHGGQL